MLDLFTFVTDVVGFVIVVALLVAPFALAAVGLEVIVTDLRGRK